MLWRKLLLIQIVLTVQLIGADEIDSDELRAQVKSHLAYQARRLKYIQSKVQPKYASDLEALLTRYTDAVKAVDPIIAQKQVLDFEAVQSEEFQNYLTLVYDEQFLEEDIRIQEWSMRELLAQLEGTLAEEIKKLLPAYDKAVKSKDFQTKYDAFAEIQEGFSDGLWKLLDADPEDKTLTNAQLKFFKEFLVYLQQQDDAKEYIGKLKTMLGEVTDALAIEDMAKKLKVLDNFDNTSTKFGRYLDYKIIEFEFDKFMQ